MVAETEVYLFVSGIALSVFGLAGGVAKKLYKRNLRIFSYLTVGGVIGILLIVSAFVVSGVMGRIKEFAVTVFTAPLELMNSASLGKSYTEACVNGICAIYCCQSRTDPDLKWKDCDPECESIEGVISENTGDTCQFSDRPAHCSKTGVGGTYTQTGSSCNNLPELGPITCTCCTSSSSGKWWDCEQLCSSHPNAIGFPLNNSECAGTQTIHCSKSQYTHDNKSDNQHNSQSY